MGEISAAAILERADAIAPVVRECASESEQRGHLAPAVVDALHEAGLFRVLVPPGAGGAGLGLPDAVDVFERVASFDTSTGWTLAILADGALFARFLAPEAAAALFADPDARIAGTLNPVTARAEPVDGGFAFSGRATYLSGSAHAKWIMAAAIVMRDGAPVVDDGGIDIRTGVFSIEQATRLDTWNVTGMRATGSTDYEFDGVVVPEPWTMQPFRPRGVRDGSDVFHSIPLWSQLGPGIAASAVGAARNMIERFVELASTKVPTGGNFSRLAERAPAQIAIGEAEGLTQAARTVLRDVAADVWRRGLEQAPFDDPVLARHRLGVVTAVRLAAQAIDGLPDAAGMNAIASDTVLDRCWREVHTITQHVILAPARYEIAGRVLLGLDAASPVI